jgi:hypothetical protein
MDTTSLRSAYAAFLDLARTGRFGAPGTPTAQWDATHVVAHVAANDELLAAVTREVLAGSAERYYNHDAVDTARLGALIADRSLADLADWLEATSTRLCDLLDTLPEDDAALVHAHIQDSGATVLDQPLPWHRFMAVQAARHLPMHTEQLRSLL